MCNKQAKPSRYQKQMWLVNTWSKTYLIRLKMLKWQQRKKNNNNKNSITVRLSYRTAKTKKYMTKNDNKKKKEMNKWMTQIKQKQGGTELQDINFYFILHLIYYPLYCVLYLACFPFILYAYYGWFSHHQWFVMTPLRCHLMYRGSC